MPHARNLAAGLAMLLLLLSATPAPAREQALPRFTLETPAGRTVTQSSFPGKNLLVYFGYTFCPDACPTGLQSLAQTMDLLGEEGSRQIQPLFITVDPERDTPEKVETYAAAFHPSILALRGTPAETGKAAKSFHIAYRKGELVEGNDYEMDCPSVIIWVKPDGHVAGTFPDNATPADIAAALAAKH